MENKIAENNWLIFKENILRKQERRRIWKKQGDNMSENFNRLTVSTGFSRSIINEVGMFIKEMKGKVSVMFKFKKNYYQKNIYNKNNDKVNKELMMDYLRMH